MLNYLLGYFDTPSENITLPEEGGDENENPGEEGEEEGDTTDEGNGDTDGDTAA